MNLIFYKFCSCFIKKGPFSAHWAKNRGQKDINSKIVEKGKIMNLLDGFQSPQIFLLQILAIFS